jgi:hypothetical protein
MFTTRLLLTSLVAIGLASLLACGKDDKSSPTTPETSVGVPFRDGLWAQHTEVSVLTGGLECSFFTEAIDETIRVTNGRISGEDAGGCSFGSSGNDFTVDCVETFTIPGGDCVYRAVIDGAGTYTDDSFTATGSLTLSGSGPCVVTPVPDCTFGFTSTGTRIANAARVAPGAGPSGLAQRLVLAAWERTRRR